MTRLQSQSNRTVLIGLFLFSVLVYGQALFFGFINYDDPYYLSKGFIKDGFQVADIKALFSETGTNLWHPLTWASFYIEAYTSSSVVSHAVNILLHALNSCLLYLVIRNIPSIAKAAIPVAILHTIHPLHIENVAWVSARKDVLSLCFILLSLQTYSHFCQQGKRFWLSLLYFILALLCKPIAVVTPVLMLAITFCHSDCIRKRSVRIALMATILLSILFCVFTIWIHRLSPNAELTVQASALDKFALIGYQYIHYVYQFLLPNKLSFFYPSGEKLSLITYLGYFSYLITLLSLLGLFYKRFQKLAVLWLLYFISLAPASGIITIGDAIRADRYLYIPAVFLALILVEISASILNKLRDKLRFCLTLCIGVWLGYLMVYGQFYMHKWRSNESLYQHAISLNKQNYLAYHNLGLAQQNQNQYELALENYRNVLAIIPDYKNVRLRIGRIYEAQGKLQQAHAYLSEEFQLHPSAENVLALAYNLYLREQYKECLALLDEHAFTSPNLTLLKAAAYHKLKRFQEAVRNYLEVPLSHFSDADIFSFCHSLLTLQQKEEARKILEMTQDKNAPLYLQLKKLAQ